MNDWFFQGLVLYKVFIHSFETKMQKDIINST